VRHGRPLFRRQTHYAGRQAYQQGFRDHDATLDHKTQTLRNFPPVRRGKSATAQPGAWPWVGVSPPNPLH
jgi:hypothetical protein